MCQVDHWQEHKKVCGQNLIPKCSFTIDIFRASFLTQTEYGTFKRQIKQAEDRKTIEQIEFLTMYCKPNPKGCKMVEMVRCQDYTTMDVFEDTCWKLGLYRDRQASDETIQLAIKKTPSSCPSVLILVVSEREVYEKEFRASG